MADPTNRTNQTATASQPVSYPMGLPVGIDWVLRGALTSEAGVDMILTSRAEPVPGLQSSVARYHSELDEAGIAVETAESDVVVAGLMRAALLAGRRVISFFEMRGLRQAMDALYEATRIHPAGKAGGVIITCEHRWMDTPQQIFARDKIHEKTYDHSNVTSPPSWLGHPRYHYSDARQLSKYLGIPVLAPADTNEIVTYINEAMRLSRASETIVMLLMTPALMGSGQTSDSRSDSSHKPIPGRIDLGHHDDSTSPIHTEARRRHLDRLINAPGPGEVVPLGFITSGTSHTALTHAFFRLGLTGRLPILKLACLNPIDHRSVEQYLLRCQKVIIIEGGYPIIEHAVLKIHRDMKANRLHPADVYGKHIPIQENQTVTDPPDQSTTHNPEWITIPDTIELHPSELINRLGPLLHNERTNDNRKVADRLSQLRQAVTPIDPATLYANLPDRSIAQRELLGLIHRLIRIVIADLADELSHPGPDRPPRKVLYETLSSTSLEQIGDNRPVIEITRRRLQSIGRAAISHTIRRHLSLVFLIVPDVRKQPGEISIPEAERVVRSLIGDEDASRVSVSRLNPADGFALRSGLREEILNDRVSIIIIESEQPDEVKPVSGDPQQWTELGYAPAEYWVRPSSSDETLCYEWLIKHGWTDPTHLDGIHAPKFEMPDTDNPLVTPIDGWEGFEELRVYRKQPPLESTVRFDKLPLQDPKPKHGNEPYWRVHLGGSIGEGFDLAVMLLEQTARRMGYRVQLLRGRSAAGVFAQMVFSRPRPDEPLPPVSARIPHGAADLIIALDMESLIEAIDPNGPHRVASLERTSLVLDVSPSLSVSSTGESTTDRSLIVPGELSRVIKPTQRMILRAGEMCDRLNSTRRFVGVMLTGVAYQSGFMPVTTEPLIRSAERLPNDPLQQGPAVLRSGRSLAARQEGGLPLIRPRPPKPEALVRLHRRVMAARPFPFSKKQADRFAALALGTLDAVTGLRRRDPERETELRFIARLIDCEYWGGLKTCRLYAEHIRAVYAAERSVTNYPVTRLVVDELAKALLIPDLFFICSTVTRPDRQRTDERLLRMSYAQGDRLTFRLRFRAGNALTRPLTGGYWKLHPYGCQMIATMNWLRIIPWWRRSDRHYREWCLALTDRCTGELNDKMSLWLEIFRQLSRIRGFGQRRQSIINRVRHAIDSLLELSDSTKNENQ